MKNVSIAERERITCYVRDELENFKRVTKGGEIKPINVQHRLNEDALYRKYMLAVNDATADELLNSRGHSSRTSVSEEPKSESLSEQISTSVSGSDDEKMEILVQPNAEQYIEQQRVYNGPRQKTSKQATANPSFPIIQPTLKKNPSKQSLLKPMHQRIIEENDANGICVVRPEIGLTKKHVELKLQQQKKQAAPPAPAPPKDESRPQQSVNPINLVRMRLSAALCKAKDEQSQQNRIQTESPETTASSSSPPVTETLTVKCSPTPLSSSQSSNDSSPASTEMESVCEVDPSEMEQDKFLGLFNLFTPTKMAYMINRRPQRKKRVCTSTERMDYYYGKYDLFEKQFTKRNKRQFLYSPPATRAKRRIASNGVNALSKDVIKAAAAATKRNNKGMKSNASSSSSLSSNASTNLTEKVCVTCYKRSKCKT